MKKMWIGFVIFLCAAVVIGVASASYARRYNYGAIRFLGGIGMVELRNTEEFAAEDIDNIEIAYSSENIILYKADADKIIIKEYLHRNRKGDSRIEKEGNTLHVKKLEGFHEIYLFGFPLGMERVEVYLPESYNKNINIETSSGNIKAESDYDFNECHLLARSGNISCNEVSASELTATASSGNISFHKAEGTRKIVTSSGNIRLDGGAGDTEVAASSGNIAVKGASGSLKAMARSGNINVEFDQLGTKVEAEASSGNIRLTIPEGSAFSYEANASSGLINTDFDESLSYNKKGNRASGTHGNNVQTAIETTTSSGNTSVKFR